MAQTHKNSSWNYAPEGPSGDDTRPNFRVVSGEEKQLFQSLEFLESRKNAVLASVGFHVVLLSVLIAIPLLFLDPPSMRRYYSLTMLAPPTPREVLEVTHWKPIALPRPKPKPIVEPPPKPLVEPKRPEPLPKPPKPDEFKLPEVKVQPKPVLLAKREEKLPEPPKPVVKTDVFAGNPGSSAKPTVTLPKAQVQTGGFGDPNGIKGEGRPDKPGNIASLGSFDLPVGPGAGNGTGGAKGTRGVVASSGFGNGVATNAANQAGTGNGRPQPTVQQGSFGDIASSVPVASPRKREAEENQTSVEITYKPRPDYTKEAREKKIEGEVLVRVLFTAAGQVKVLGISRGLGFGLDESALRAAQQIRFKPSTRGGVPVDSTATVHILFQLAY